MPVEGERQKRVRTRSTAARASTEVATTPTTSLRRRRRRASSCGWSAGDRNGMSSIGDSATPPRRSSKGRARARGMRRNAACTWMGGARWQRDRVFVGEGEAGLSSAQRLRPEEPAQERSEVVRKPAARARPEVFPEDARVHACVRQVTHAVRGHGSRQARGVPCGEEIREGFQDAPVYSRPGLRVRGNCLGRDGDVVRAALAAHVTLAW